MARGRNQNCLWPGMKSTQIPSSFGIVTLLAVRSGFYSSQHIGDILLTPLCGPSIPLAIVFMMRCIPVIGGGIRRSVIFMVAVDFRPRLTGRLGQLASWRYACANCVHVRCNSPHKLLRRQKGMAYIYDDREPICEGTHDVHDAWGVTSCSVANPSKDARGVLQKAERSAGA